jgi:ribosomal protein L37AE/L43A
MSKTFKPTCKLCGEFYEAERLKIGYGVCLDCGDDIAKDRKFTIAPLNKSNYYYISDMETLKQLNPKRTT